MPSKSVTSTETVILSVSCVHNSFSIHASYTSALIHVHTLISSHKIHVRSVRMRKDFSWTLHKPGGDVQLWLNQTVFPFTQSQGENLSLMPIAHTHIHTHTHIQYTDVRVNSNEHMRALKSFLKTPRDRVSMRGKKAKGSERRLTIMLFYLELLLGMKEGQESTTAVCWELICGRRRRRRSDCHRGADRVSVFVSWWIICSVQQRGQGCRKKRDNLCTNWRKVSI